MYTDIPTHIHIYIYIYMNIHILSNIHTQAAERHRHACRVHPHSSGSSMVKQSSRMRDDSVTRKREHDKGRLSYRIVSKGTGCEQEYGA